MAPSGDVYESELTTNTLCARGLQFISREPTLSKVIDVTLESELDGPVILYEDEWGDMCVHLKNRPSRWEDLDYLVRQYLYENDIKPGSYRLTITPVQDEVTDETEVYPVGHTSEPDSV
jgi:hypothetical protein